VGGGGGGGGEGGVWGGGGGGGGVVTEATHQIVMSTSTLKTRAVDENTLQKNKF